MSQSSTLIIPVESQVRELDAKILLSCVAAERGFPVILGSRAYTHFIASSVPRGVYMAKSARSLSSSMFRILRMIGHDIVAWEEEALVHPPPEIYYTLRLSPSTILAVSHVFAWGQDNAELLASYPHLPPGLPLHVTGNPRGDMLRPEIRPYFAEEVARLRATYGEFLLINTNFSDVNPFIPGIGLFKPSKPGKPPRRGQAGLGMTQAFADGLRDHKQVVFDAFRAMIPKLAAAFPDLRIVVRPHPSEKHDPYRALQTQCPQVEVTNNGSIIPWLLAAKAMVHNGCTTGLEAYLLRRPAVSHLPTVNTLYDYDFQGVPTRLSHQSFSLPELEKTLTQILAGDLGAAAGAEREALVDRHIAARDGPLACDRIVDVLTASGYLDHPPPARQPLIAAGGRVLCAGKAFLTQLNMRRPGPNRQSYHDHRFPETAVADIQLRIARFRALLNRFHHVEVRRHSQHVFQIASAAP